MAGEGQLDEDERGGELPGVMQFSGSVDLVTAALEGNIDGAIREGLIKVEAAALEEVLEEGIEDLIQGAGALPDAVAAKAGLM